MGRDALESRLKAGTITQSEYDQARAALDLVRATAVRAGATFPGGLRR
jgi:outer membrane protein TolC